ncbi:MAG: dehydratase, partial [Rhodocyclaceae bacterium]|nr:dehydratase [Rhodocyclaceae bacterium]
MSKKKLYWEDFPVGSVAEYGGITLSKEDIVRFAREFDPQPFHIDEEAAKHSQFGGLIASGWHTCSLCMRMMCDAYLLDSA